MYVLGLLHTGSCLIAGNVTCTTRNVVYVGSLCYCRTPSYYQPGEGTTACCAYGAVWDASQAKCLCGDTSWSFNALYGGCEPLSGRAMPVHEQKHLTYVPSYMKMHDHALADMHFA